MLSEREPSAEGEAMAFDMKDRLGQLKHVVSQDLIVVTREFTIKMLLVVIIATYTHLLVQ